ncbi:ATP-binding protein, partial [Candidatus Woesearchaeota archaeon]|nr:ATP-binding protein [Candidatus Woesearchaeota archaeon]
VIMEYLERKLFKEVIKWIDRREILVIKGPRQSGKTTLLHMIEAWLVNSKKINPGRITFITFEDRELLEQFSTDPKCFVKRFSEEKEKHYLLIDEAHYCTELGQKLKLLYDLNENIKFIIAGSSSFELTTQTGKFLVGRMFSFELLPFSFYEFLLAKDKNLAKIYLEQNEGMKNLILKCRELKYERNDIFINELLRYLEEYLVFGGYPEVVKTDNPDEKRIILKNIFNTYLEKDILAQMQITDLVKFRKLVSMLSSALGSIASYEKLASGCNSHFKEIIKLLDILQQSYIVQLLRPYHNNLVTELRKNPKIYFYDVGLRNYAINNFNKLDIRNDSGELAENFVLNEIRSLELDINFWRTTAKAEVDFILSRGNHVVAVEAKFENMKKPKTTKSFHSFLNAYKPKIAIIVTKNLWAEKKINETTVKFVPIVYI